MSRTVDHAIRATKGERIWLRVRSARLLLRLSQKQLGALCGVSQAVISNWEKLKREPTRSDLQTLSEALGIALHILECDVRQLFTGDNQRQRNPGYRLIASCSQSAPDTPL